MINAGKFNRRIDIVRRSPVFDKDGYDIGSEQVILTAWASISTTRGFTLISSGSNFSDATTGMLIRHPNVEISRKDIVRYNGSDWSIEYINDIDDLGKFLELQVKEIKKDG